MSKTLGLAAKHAVSDLRPIYIERPEPMGSEVEIEVMFCGVCHSDVHQAKNEWMNTVYPCMPATRSSAASPRSAPRQRSSGWGDRRGGLHGRLMRRLPELS